MMAGQQITPTLRLVRPLGQGAMGSVWVADHLALNTQVAVKFMMPDAARDPELVARFRREATAAAQIKSPHVAQVFDHGVAADGSLYIVMELLEGEDLKRRLARLGPLPPREVARIITQTARALGRAHQIGIVHRDIKPDNLFLLDLDGEPFVKVVDFGIAKQARRGDMGMTSTGSLLGTPFYMSPEQLLSSKHVDAHADLWALGVVAYQALTGKLPFTGETLGALAVAVSSGLTTLPSQIRPGLTAAVDAWVSRALQRDPAARFGSAKEMAEALEMAVGGGEGGRAAMASAGDVGAAAAEGGAHPPLGGSGPHGMAGSGAQARTLQGVAGTGAGRGSRRTGVILGALGISGLTLAGGGVLLATRGGTDDPAASATEVLPEAGQASALPAEDPTSAASTSAASPVSSASAAPTAAASASAAPPVAADGGATPTTPDAKAKDSPTSRPRPRSKDGEDDVGF